jgi:hypothetical protein
MQPLLGRNHPSRRGSKLCKGSLLRHCNSWRGNERLIELVFTQHFGSASSGTDDTRFYGWLCSETAGKTSSISKLDLNFRALAGVFENAKTLYLLSCDLWTFNGSFIHETYTSRSDAHAGIIQIWRSIRLVLDASMKGSSRTLQTQVAKDAMVLCARKYQLTLLKRMVVVGRLSILPCFDDNGITLIVCRLIVVKNQIWECASSLHQSSLRRISPTASR